MDNMDLFEENLNPFSDYDDVFDISGICSSEHTVHCDHHTSYDDVPYSTQCYSPSPQDLIGASMGTVDLVYRCNTSKFPIVFDTGASLAISMDKSDFVGSIFPLSQTLGGLVNGLDIVSIGTVHWKFR